MMYQGIKMQFSGVIHVSFIGVRTIHFLKDIKN